MTTCPNPSISGGSDSCWVRPWNCRGWPASRPRWRKLPHDDRGDSILGRCPAMIEVYKAIGRVAAQDVTVLITGESGTGARTGARAIYQHSARVCAPFPGHQLRSHPRTASGKRVVRPREGAFTGADRKRIGKFEQCNGGTIFLDEVGDMPLATQAKMLRLLQEQTFERVGGNETVRTGRSPDCSNQPQPGSAAAAEQVPPSTSSTA